MTTILWIIVNYLIGLVVDTVQLAELVEEESTGRFASGAWRRRILLATVPSLGWIHVQPMMDRSDGFSIRGDFSWTSFPGPPGKWRGRFLPEERSSSSRTGNVGTLARSSLFCSSRRYLMSS